MDDDDDRYRPSYRLRPLHLVIATLSSISSWIEDITELLCAHHNWKIERAKVAAEMHADLESIVGGE